jgi:hypothetical protein
MHQGSESLIKQEKQSMQQATGDGLAPQKLESMSTPKAELKSLLI